MCIITCDYKIFVLGITARATLNNYGPFIKQGF